jgi:hypothetical protein
MHDGRLEVGVSFDPTRGYFTTGGELRPTPEAEDTPPLAIEPISAAAVLAHVCAHL